MEKNSFVNKVTVTPGNRHETMPIYESLLEYHDNDTVPLNFPGHKRGCGAQSEFRDFIGTNVLSIDVSAFQQVDCLHKPEGPIKHAEELAADAFGADVTYFCVQGTSCAIQAMVMSVVGRNEKIIIPRNVHKSVISGIILSGAVPVYMQPEIDDELGFALNVTPETVLSALLENPDAKAVLIVNPTYYGISAALGEIANIVHQYSIPLLVDEAHGPHFHFSKGLPPSAMSSGADMCAQSTHKILGALSQSSMLHVKKLRVDVHRVKAVLNLIHSTSPSYVLLASLDAARFQMATSGEMVIEKMLMAARFVRSRINAIPGLSCFSREITLKKGASSFDETKITITCKNLGITGYALERILSEEYHIQAEMADIYNVLCVISVGTTMEHCNALICALTIISKKYHLNDSGKNSSLVLPSTPEQVVPPDAAFWGKTHVVSFLESAGKVSAEFLYIYPPGIPVISPGERMTQEIVDYITRQKNIGFCVQGTMDTNLNVIKVLAESIFEKTDAGFNAQKLSAKRQENDVVFLEQVSTNN